MTEEDFKSIGDTKKVTKEKTGEKRIPRKNIKEFLGRPKSLRSR